MDKQIIFQGIGSGIRSLMQVFPYTAPIAQAWGEYLAFQQEQTIKDFFENIKLELERYRERLEKLECISNPMLQAKILTILVQKLVLEPDDEKRKYYAKFFVNGILDPLVFDEQRLLLEIFDELLITELIILQIVSKQKQATGSTIGNEIKDGHAYVMPSLARLNSKGLIEVIEHKNPQRVQFFSMNNTGKQELTSQTTLQW